jgi:hypothetical protein
VIPFRALVVLPAAGLLAAVAAAQLDAAQQPEERPAAKPAAATPPDPAAERTEDVEVLRRILNNSLGLPDKLAAVYQNYVPLNPGGFGGQPGFGGFGGNLQGFGGIGGFHGGGFSGDPGGISGNPQGFVPANNPNVTFNQPLSGNTLVTSQPQIGPFDGVYLAGHGVVYTLHVPERLGFWLRPPDRAVGLADFCAKCHATEPTSRANLEPTAPAGKPASEWDRVRDELQGKKAESRPPQPAAVSGAVCEPGKTAERIVGKLARNARHVRHLPAGESVTVVVTYDGVSGSAKDRHAIDPAGGPPAGQPRTAPKGPAGRAGFTPEEVNQLTLGDLHLKQGKPREAAAAYERALARYKEPLTKVTAPAGLSEDQQRLLVGELGEGVRGAYAKLAQAWLAAGDRDKAAAALKLSQEFKVDLVTGATPAREKAVPVPAKLVISVAKADLDKAGDDPAAFRKLVKVETVGFPPADKKKP